MAGTRNNTKIQVLGWVISNENQLTPDPSLLRSEQLKKFSREGQ